MFREPALAVFEVAVVIATMVLVVGAMYIGGGTAAIRRQVPQLGLLAGALVVMPFAIPLLMDGLGDLNSGLVILGLNAAVFIAWALQRRRGEGPLVAQQWRQAFRLPAFRTLIAAWVAFLLIGTVLLIIAARASA